MKKDIKVGGKKKSILIIGNGFDRANNLSTSYFNFFEYLKEKYEKAGQQKSLNINELNDNNEEGTNLIKKFNNNYFINFFLKTNIWFENWFNLEEELANILTIVMKVVSLMNDVRYLNNNTANPAHFIIRKKDLEDTIKIDQYNRLFFFISWRFFRYEEGRFSDNSLFYKVFITNKDTVKLRESEELFSFKREVINELWEDFRYLESLFRMYLEEKVNPEIKKLKKISIQKCVNSENKIVKVISYNYTRTPQQIFGINDDDVFYIHGRDDDIIFGVDEDLINKNIKEKVRSLRDCFLNFYKNSIRFDYYDKADLDLPSFIDEAKEFYIFGHSINDQDLNSLRGIFKNNFVEKKISVFYINEDDKNRKLNNLNKLVGEEKLLELRESRQIIFRPSSDFNLKQS